MDVFRRTAIKLGALLIACVQIGPGFAGVQDSVFFISPDGDNVAFEVRNVSRREVLDRLLNSKSIEHEWVDVAFADEPISGSFKGSVDDVLQRLLAQANFVAIYAPGGDDLVRLIIVGRSTSQPNTAGVAKMAGATPSTNVAGTPLATPPPPAGAQSAMTPPTPGSVAPPLVPPTPSDATAPLLLPPPGMAPPLLVPSPSDVAPPLFQVPGTQGK